MKATRRLLFVIQIFVCFLANAQNDNSVLESIARNISDVAQCDKQSSMELIDALFEYKDNLGIRLGQIADPRIAVLSREQIAKETISQFFVSETSPVQVSSKYRQTVSQKPVREYFTNLMRLNLTRRYINVELSFTPGMGFVGIKQVGYNKLEVATSVWQIFRGETDSGYIYSDATRKKIRQLVERDNRGRWIIKATEISVSETRSLEDWIRDERVQKQ